MNEIIQWILANPQKTAGIGVAIWEVISRRVTTKTDVTPVNLAHRSVNMLFTAIRVIIDQIICNKIKPNNVYSPRVTDSNNE